MPISSQESNCSGCLYLTAGAPRWKLPITFHPWVLQWGNCPFLRHLSHCQGARVGTAWVTPPPLSPSMVSTDVRSRVGNGENTQRCPMLSDKMLSPGGLCHAPCSLRRWARGSPTSSALFGVIGGKRHLSAGLLVALPICTGSPETVSLFPDWGSKCLDCAA